MSKFFMKDNNKIIAILEVNNKEIVIIKKYDDTEINLDEIKKFMRENVNNNRKGFESYLDEKKSEFPFLLPEGKSLVEIKVTYAQVLKFYLSKSSECTKELIEYLMVYSKGNLIKDDAPYIGLYNNFKNIKNCSYIKTINEEICEYNDDMNEDDKYSLELKKFLCGKVNIKKYNEKSNKVNVANLFTFNEVAELYNLSNLNFINDIIFNQKWHLIISYSMYKLLNENKKLTSKFSGKSLKDWFEYFDGARCPELILWMIEAAGIEIDYSAIMDEAKELVNQYTYETDNFDKNNYNIKMCEYIKDKYPWSDIAKIIIEPCPLPEDNSKETKE